MPREKELFRDNLERLDKAFPNKELLQKKDVITYTGAGYKIVTRMYEFNNNTISKVKLARALS